MSLSWKALLTIAAIPVVLVSSARAHRSAPCPAAAALLPDLVQEVPSDITVDMTRSGPRIGFRLGFTTTIANTGAGPIEVVGHRGAGQTVMRAEQVVRTRDGESCVRPGAGALRYDFRQTHDHWHLLDFDRYALTRPDGSSAPAPSRKAGFCLGDRTELRRRVPGSVARPRWTSECALDQPRATAVSEGISIGWADVYPAYVEGQVLDISRVQPGHYVLVNIVNPARALVESRYGNDSASVLIDLRWPHGRAQFPTVRVLAACPGRRHCG